MNLKKLYLFILFLVFAIPVRAENTRIHFDLCKSNCSYSSFTEIYEYIKTLDFNQTYDFVVEIKDSNEYETYDGKITLFHDFAEYYNISKSSFTVLGNENRHPTIVSNSEFLDLSKFDHTDIQNVDFRSDYTCWFDYNDSDANSSLSISNSKMICSRELSMNVKDVLLDNVTLTTDFLFTPYISRKVVYKNSNFNITSKDTELEEVTPTSGIRFDTEQVEITNTTLKTNFMFGTTGTDYLIKDSNFNVSIDLNLGSTNIIIDDTSIDVKREFTLFGNVDINNSTINSSNDIALDIRDAVGSIKNTTIQGATKYGLSYVTSNFASGYTLELTNVDLMNNTDSIYINTYNPCENVIEGPCNIFSRDVELMPNKHGFTINVVLLKSKIKSIFAEDKQKIGPSNVYVDGDTVWENEIVRSTDLKSGNVVELDGSKVLIDRYHKELLSVYMNDEIDIFKFFDELNEIPEQIQWHIQDESVVKMENNKLIPLRIGETEITSYYNNNYYQLDVVVTDKDLSNPLTKTNLLIGFFILLIFFVDFILIYIHSHKTVKK